jgi:acetoacetate decarboxylase
MTIRYGARDLAAQTPASSEAPAMWSRTFVTWYETDPEVIAAVLPPPLVPSDRPLVRVNIAAVDMPGTDYTLGAGVFSVECKHGDLVGLYDLTMVMSVENAVLGGRDVYGEPKKLGQVALTRDGDRITGAITRNGITYLEVHGTATERLEPRPTSTRTAFYFKFLLDPQGGGFDAPPSLVHCVRTETQRHLERVEATVLLRESSFDPVIDVPVRRVVSSEYSESNTTQDGTIVGTVDGDALLPFVHQRYDAAPAMQRLRTTSSGDRALQTVGL